jgi:electron transfer flavoprotein beta subunit
MKILVCIGQVPDTTSKISFTDNDTKFNGTGVQFVIGPYDEYALAKAVEIKETSGADITVFNVGEDTEAIIRKALAIGADDAVRVNAFPIDSFFVATQIAAYAKDKGFDMILMGRESIDFNGGVVHGMVAEMLGIPSVTPIMHLDINSNKATVSKEIEGGKEVLEVSMPFVAGCQEPIAEWKIPNMKGIMSARTKPLAVIDAVNADTMTKVLNYQLPPAKSGCKFVDASEPEKLIELLKNEAKVI